MSGIDVHQNGIQFQTVAELKDGMILSHSSLMALVNSATTSRKHPGQVKTSRFLILSQSTGMRGCVILLEDEAISTEEQEELLFWDVLT
uniref:Uncharacterized protein n=1 Tax=Caenorhabditis japonica TaxID=281687 RepID=A0A8R1ET27_CAEJA